MNRVEESRVSVQSDQRVSLGKQEKRVERSAPTVSFVTSFEDELDIGDLF